LAGDEQIIMYTGNLYPRKGSEMLVQAADQLDGHLVVVGGTDERIEQLQNDYACENVTFVGYVEPSAVPSYQQSADVLVAPYTTAALMPSPLKLFEYMAAGSPIVAARIPTISEVLEHEATALLFEPGDRTQFVIATNRLLENPAFGANLAETASKVVEQYSWEQRAQRIRDFIEFRC
jgi:glycosyltransferase involved in cell wall biosynthesis